MFEKLKNKIQYAALVAPIYAQESLDLTPKGEFKGLDSLSATSIVSGAINLVLLVVALVFFFILIYGGLRWIMSEGDEKAVASARNQITNALIGMAVVFSAFAIIKLIQVIFGIDLMKMNIPTFTGN